MIQIQADTRVRPQLLAASPHLHRLGTLEVRLAASDQEVAAAQALRYRIFHDEMGAEPSDLARRSGRDIDPFDDLCDHLLVIDHGDGGEPHVVGTYRLLRQRVAESNGGFYSASEYDLSLLLDNCGGQLLELGRSCVAPSYRNRLAIGLLWRGIGTYLARHKISYLFGCASLPGADADLHAAELSYLHHHHLAPPHLRARSLAHVPMDRLTPGSYDPRMAQAALPPLMKGYLRAGAMVGHGAFLDHRFGTTDLFVIMPVERISGRYRDRFGGGC